MGYPWRNCPEYNTTMMMININRKSNNAKSSRAKPLRPSDYDDERIRQSVSHILTRSNESCG